VSRVPDVELLYWLGCPSYDEARADLRAALDELGRPEIEIALIEITTDAQAAEHEFVGSPTVRVDGIDPVPPPPGEPTGLTCRVYRRRDGRYSPTPDPADLRDALRRLLARSTQEA